MEEQDILRPLEGMKRAEPRAGLYEEIHAKWLASKPVEKMKSPYVFLAAASLIGLICVNFLLISHYQTEKQTRSDKASRGQQLETANFDLYE